MENNLNLLEKTELWVDSLHLDGANLTDMAHAVADVLGIPKKNVMVVDVRPDHITFDLVDKVIPQENIIGKAQDILDALWHIPGVYLNEDTYIHTNGILGLIYADPTDAEIIKSRSDAMVKEISERLTKRAIVFPTGFEIEQGLIEDTNTPYIKRVLEDNGYVVSVGDVIPDSEYIMTDMLREALDRGFGLIITSGGVGAEDKDFSVESVLNIDPDAAVSYVVKYEKGMGRHVKDGVRVAVGQVGLTKLVTLPGPHDEVEMTMPVLAKMLVNGMSKEEMAPVISGILADKWRRNNVHHDHHDA